MWLVVMGYFVLACGVAALLLLPAVRQRCWAQLQALAQRLHRSQHAARQQAQHTTARTLSDAATAARSSSAFARRHALALGGAAGLLLLPPLVVFTLRGEHTLDAFDDDSSSPKADPVVGALLNGEQLVPPPALPPEVFATAELEVERPKLVSADRRWDQFDSEFRQRLLLVYQLMRQEHGYDMVLLEGYRSPERQNMLAGMGWNVTSAAAWQSYHQYGMAADNAFLRAGKIVISERDPWAMRGYELYGEVARRVGLTWGGRWKNADLGHVELRRPGTIRPKVGG